MKAVLVFPPATDPRAPQLALPSLAAALRGAGIETKILDLNIQSLLALLRPESIAKAGQGVKKACDHATGEMRERLRCVASLSDHLAEVVEKALQTLRDDQSFFDPNLFNSARNTICSVIDLHCVAARRPISYNILPVRYDVEGIDPQVLADLLRITTDRDSNLFWEIWEKEFISELNRDRPDVIGISITNRQQLLPGLMLAHRLRELGHFVIIGGAVFTKFASQLAKLPVFFERFTNGVIVYEGETAMLELVNQLAGKRDFHKVPNFLYYEGGEVRATRTHVENVEELPTPDFEGLPLHDYLAPLPVLPILTGKGCYFNRCKFCDIPYINHISKKAYRVRSPERIVADVRELARRFDCHHFVITDEALSPKLLLQLADAFSPYHEEQYFFTGYARLEKGFTPEACRQIARMGMKKIFFGLESASQATLDHMDKGIKVVDAPAILKNCRDVGINFHLFSIIGFPEEEEDSARETFEFFVRNADVINHPGNSFDIHPFGLELRTPYFDEAAQSGVQIKAGALDKDFIIGLQDTDWKNSRGLSAERVKELIEEEFYPALRNTYRLFHSCPLHLWPGFEEYAVLYGGYYAEQPFRFQTCLPREGDERPFKLCWDFAAKQELDEGLMSLITPSGPVSIDSDVFCFLGENRFRTIDELLGEALGEINGEESHAIQAQFLEDVGALIRAGLLQVELAGPAGSGLPHIERRNTKPRSPSGRSADP